MKKKKIVKIMAVMLSVIMIITASPEFFGKIFKIFSNMEISGSVIKNTESIDDIVVDDTQDDYTVLPVANEVVDTSGTVIATAAITVLGDASFPATYAELLATGKDTFYIKTYQDWLNLQALSKENDLDGFTFTINNNNTPGVKNFSVYELDSLPGFTGIGSEEHPFAGTLKCSSTNGISYNVKAPVFQYLSAKATVRNLHIRCTGSTCVAGLAKTLTGSGTLKLENIFVSGSVINKTTDGGAGGLFSEIINNEADGLYVSVTKETGASRNGIALGVTGTDTALSTKLTISGYYSGSIAGIVKGNVIFEYDNDVISIKNTSIAGTDKNGDNGFLFGRMESLEGHKPVIRFIKDADIMPRFGYSNSLGNSGGIVGYGKECIIDTAGHTVTIESSSIDSNGNHGASNYVDIYGNTGNKEKSGVGGIAGVFVNSEVTSDSIFYIQNIRIEMAMNGYAAGGGFGYVENSMLGSFADDNRGYIIRNAKICTQSTESNRTGVLIGCYKADDGNNYIINNVSVYNTRAQSYKGPSGGVAGYVVLDNESSLKISDCSMRGVFVTARMDASNRNSDIAGCGGFVGRVEGSTDKECFININNCSYVFGHDSSYRNIYMSSTEQTNLWIWADYCPTGGIAGRVKDVNIIVDTISMENLYNVSSMENGGVIGYIGNTSANRYAYIKNIDFTGTLRLGTKDSNNTYPAGAIVGKAGHHVAMSLDGTINFSDMKWIVTKCSYVGQIAGINLDSLIFIEKNAEFSPYNNTDASYIRDVDMVGNYGGVLYNDYYDNDTELLFKSKSTSPVNGNVSKDGSAYNINTTGDLLRLSVLFNTEGEFGTEAFDGITYADALKGEYHLTNTLYDLTSTGFVSMQRNRGKGDSLTNNASDGVYFTGKFIGTAAEKSVIKQKTELHRQPYMGFFIYLGDNADNVTEIANIDMEQEINQTSVYGMYYYNVAYIGGFATFAKGSINVNNMTVSLNSSTVYCNAGDKGCIGGLFGRYVPVGKSVLNVKDLNASGDKSLYDRDNITGQVIGYVDSPNGYKPVLKFENIDISGNVENKRKGEQASGATGFIGVINNLNYNLWDNKGNLNVRTVLNVKDINLHDLNIKTDSTTNRSAGLLGLAWTDVDTEVTNITVNRCNVTGYNYFGGFVTEVTGKMVLDNIDISNFNMNISSPKYNGLLIGISYNAYVSVKDYHIDTDTTIISGMSTGNFDEISGWSISNENTGGIVSISSSDGKYLVKDSYKTYKNQATYRGTSADKINNNWTRYYYNIPEIMADAVTKAGNRSILADNVINNEEELMIWHLLNYSYVGVKSYFTVDNQNYGNLTGRNYNFSGTFDLREYSYYPTTVSGKTFKGTDSARFIFYAQDICNAEKDNYQNAARLTNDSVRQHYRMHAGLFYNVTACNISNMTLEGTVTSAGKTSGALISGNIYGVGAGKEDKKNGYTYSNSTSSYTKILEIDIDNVWVAGQSTMAGCGLLVNHVAEGAKVTFDSVKMINYGNTHTATSCSKAAAALIGMVGSANPTSAIIEIQISFSNMDIADVADKVTVPQESDDLKNSKEEDKVLQYASFIYEYQYYEDTCSGLYTFYQADYLKGKGLGGTTLDNDSEMTMDRSKGYITMGYEIGDKTEFYDTLVSTPILSYKGNTEGNNIYGFSYSNYKPYVYNYTKREIAVNPKPGNIEKGCGTYEDPYIIENSKQLQSLYYYLKDNVGYVRNWKVVKTGNDTVFCTGTDHGELKVYGSPDFPTRSELNQAYYKITAEIIDFSKFTDFTGFGTESLPFVGVFVGEKGNDGKCPVIKLPDETTNNVELDCFGLIKYAKGCVIKDIDVRIGMKAVTGRLSLVTARPVLTSGYFDMIARDGAATSNEYIKVKESGAGVIAYVLGGDNVIDNVTVKGTLKPVNKNTTIGGYVGSVNLGTVIIRNMTNDSLNGFSVVESLDKGDDKIVGTNDEYINRTSFLYIGGIIGNVKDGNVFYDRYSDNTVKVIKDITGIYSNSSGLIGIPNYYMINSSYISAGTKINGILDQNGFTAKVHDEAGLIIMQAALNGGAFTYEGRKETVAGYAIGYNCDSRCRNGNYDKIGNVASNDVDYLDVIKNDNLNGAQADDGNFFKPYVFDFVDMDINNLFTGITASQDNYFDENVKSSYIDMDNKLFTLELDNKDYDLSDVRYTFRGFGAQNYTKVNNFKGNIAGNNSNVTVDIIANNVRPASYTGFINNIIIGKQTDTCYVKDITIKGNVINTDDFTESASDMDAKTDTDSVNGKTAAGLIGRISVTANLNLPGNTYYFENVKVEGLDAGSKEHSSGLIGLIKTTSTTDKYGFKDCNVRYLNAYGAADTAGYIASYQEGMNVSFENCDVADTVLNSRGIYVTTFTYTNGSRLLTRLYPSAGGYIGRGIATDKTITIKGGNLNNISIQAKGHSGGLIGQTESLITCSDFTAGNVEMKSLGMLNEKGKIDRQEISGNRERAAANNWWTYADYRSRYLGNFGGYFGYAGRKLTVDNCTLTNVDIDVRVGSGLTNVTPGNLGSTYSYTAVGGFVGSTDYDAYFTRCTLGSSNGSIKLISDAGYTEGGKNTATSEITSNNIVAVGGFIGSAGNRSNDNKYGYTFDNCKVIGNSYVTNKISSGYSAGGFVGVSKNANNAILGYYNCSVTDMNIKSIRKAGGYLGFGINSNVIRVSNSEVSDSTIEPYDVLTSSTDVASGGFFGDSRSLIYAYNIHSKGNTVGNRYSYASGGFIGIASQAYGLMKATKSDSTYNKVYGCLTGGIAGNMARSSTYTSELSDVNIKSNKIIGIFADDRKEVYAGGAYGYITTSNNTRLVGSDIKIEENLIAAYKDTNKTKAYVGGFAGRFNDNANIKSLQCNNNIIGMIKDANTEDSHYNIWTDAGLVSASELKNAAGYIGTVYRDSNSNIEIREFPDRIEEADLHNYSSQTGLFTGIKAGGNINVTDFTVEYRNDLKKYIPASDVGYNGYCANNQNMYSYRSSYRIIYGGTDFNALDTIWDNYKDGNRYPTENYRLQYNYRLNQKFEDVLNNTYKDTSGEYISPYKDSNGKSIPMVVFDNSDLDSLLSTYANLITNNGGILSNNGYSTAIIKVTPKKMKVVNGVASVDTSGTPSIKVSNTNVSNQVSFSVNSAGYDVCDDENNGTYTVLQIDYTWTEGSNRDFQYGPDTSDTFVPARTYTYKIEIPVFVKKILEIDTHIIGVTGSNYEIDNILNNGVDHMSILRGTYTSYIEYVYNDAIPEYNETLKKELYFLDNSGGAYVPIFKNTKMTLVDLSDNSVYYYKVPDDIVGKLLLSEFKDANGNPYTEPVLSTLPLVSGEDKLNTLYYKHYAAEVGNTYNSNEKIAMQRYLLLVDTSEVVNDTSVSYTYTVNMKPAENEQGMGFLKRCRYPVEPECEFTITEITGITADFTHNTSITGEIREDSRVGLNANIEYTISASEMYWDYKNSSPSVMEEYIDIAFYLEKGGKKVALPEGTIVTFNKGTPDEVSTVTNGEILLYNYKDSFSEMPLMNITADVTKSCTIDFDFSQADFTSFDTGNYTVKLELLKTTEKDFPMGGDRLDDYAMELTTITDRNLGFVLEAKDLMTLGMNGYSPEQSDLGNVEYTTSINFTDYIPKNDKSNRTDFEQLAEKYFTIRYRVERKKKNSDGTYTYVPYTGDSVKLYYDGKEITSDKGLTFRLSQDTLIKGNRGLNDHVYELPFSLKADVESLLKINENITNYRVVGELYISDISPDGTTLPNDSDIIFTQVTTDNLPDTSLSDYFVFTIAKIKTDLDL